MTNDGSRLYRYMLSRTVCASQGNIVYPNQKLWLIPIKPTATEHIVVDKMVIEDEIARRRRVRIVVLTRKGKAWFLVHLS